MRSRCCPTARTTKKGVLPAKLYRGVFAAVVALVMPACSIPDNDSPAQLKFALEQAGWHSVSTGRAGYVISPGGVERYVDGIRGIRESGAARLHLAIGRFRADANWWEAISGQGPGNISLTGAGLLLDGSLLELLQSGFGWTGETAHALAEIFSGGRRTEESAFGATWEIAGKFGSVEQPVTIELSGVPLDSGPGFGADLSLSRDSDRLRFGIVSRLEGASSGSSAVFNVEITPDIGPVIGPVLLNPESGTVELLGPADLSLLVSFLVPDFRLLLGKGSSLKFSGDEIDLTLEESEAGLPAKLLAKGRISLHKYPDGFDATLRSGPYPATVEWRNGRLERVVLEGKQSTIAWPERSQGVLAPAEFLNLFWDKKTVDLSGLVFQEVSISPGGFTASWAPLRTLAETVPPLYGFASARVSITGKYTDLDRRISVDLKDIDRPLSAFSMPALSVMDLLQVRQPRALFQTRIRSSRFGLAMTKEGIQRELWVDTDRFQLMPSGPSRFTLRLSASTEPVAEFLITGPLLSSRVDFIAGPSRQRFMEWVAEELR